MPRYTARMTLATRAYLALIAVFAASTLVNLAVTLNRVEDLIFLSQSKVHNTLLDGISHNLTSVEKCNGSLTLEDRDNILATWESDMPGGHREMIVLDGSGRSLVGTKQPGLDMSLLTEKRGELNYIGPTGAEIWFVYEHFPEWDITVGYQIPQDHRYDRVRELRRNLLPSFIVIPVFAILLFVFLIIRTVLPLRRLTCAALAVSEGDLDRPVGIRQRDEIGILADSFDEMRNAIRRQIGDLAAENERRRIAERELHDLNASLEKAVEERTFELRESMRDLEHAQRRLVESEKSASLATLIIGIAHEINTPLGIGITGLSYLSQELETCRDNPETSEEEYRYVVERSLEATRMSVRSLERVGNLIQNLKSVSTDEADDTLGEIVLLDFVREFSSSFHKRLEEANCRIDFAGDESLAVTTYPGVLMQVFSRLFDNAFIHGLDNDDEGLITIEVTKPENAAVRIRFHDNGRGMERKVSNHVFEPFFTTDRGGGRPGLGLYIVYNLVDKYLKGKVECCSEPGTGSCFVLDLPDLAGFQGGRDSSSDGNRMAM